MADHLITIEDEHQKLIPSSAAGDGEKPTSPVTENKSPSLSEHFSQPTPTPTPQQPPPPPVEPSPLDEQYISRTGAVAAFILGSAAVGKLILKKKTTDGEYEGWEILLKFCIYTAVAGVGMEVNRMMMLTNYRVMKWNNLAGRVITTMSFYLSVLGFMLHAYAMGRFSWVEIVGNVIAFLPVWTFIVRGGEWAWSNLCH